MSVRYSDGLVDLRVRGCLTVEDPRPRAQDKCARAPSQTCDASPLDRLLIPILPTATNTQYIATKKYTLLLALPLSATFYVLHKILLLISNWMEI